MHNRPRVVAEYGEGAIMESSLDGPARTSASVAVTLAFDLGDHALALAALHRAVADVEAQVAEASR